MTVLRAGPCAGLCAAAVLPRPLVPCFGLRVPAAAMPAPMPTTTAAVPSGRRPLSLCAHARSRRRPRIPCSLPTATPPALRRLLFTAGPPVITHYVDLPPDYEDAKGLPFRQPRRRRRLGGDSSTTTAPADTDDLDAAEAAAIFGPGRHGQGTALAPAAASRLLRILHGRRVAGTLDDPAVRAATARYSAAEVAAALAYLRRTVPVDEVINAGLRAEDELAAMGADAEGAEGAEGAAAETAEVMIPTPQETEQADATSTTTTTTTTTTPSPWRARLFREPPQGDVYGEGVLDRIRAQNLARAAERERAQAEAEAAERAAQEQAWAEQAAAGGGGGRAVVAADGDGAAGTSRAVAAPRAMSPRMQKWALAATSTLEAPPEMPAWQRLGPSYAFAAAVVAGGGLLAAWAVPDAVVGAGAGAVDGLPAPPAPEDVSPLTGASRAATTTVLGLVAANVAVFVLWRVPPLWRLLNRYALVVPATPRPASLLGAVFSHQRPGHLAANMAFLVFLGLRLHDEIGGRAPFLALYTAGGVLAFAASLTHLVLWPGQLHLTTLGASGALYAVATAYFVLHQADGFKILGLPPDPYAGVQGLGFVGLLLVMNLLALRAEHHKRSIDLVTHFAGMAVGGVVGEVLYRRRQAARAAAAPVTPGPGPEPVSTDVDTAVAKPDRPRTV